MINYEFVKFAQYKLNKLTQKRTIELYLYNNSILENDKNYYKLIIDDIDKEIAFYNKAQLLLMHEN